jgi:hypothetical protein
MIAALVFGLLSAQTGAAAAGAAPMAASSVPSAPASPVRASNSSAAAASAPSEDPPLDLDQLRQMYRDTCEAREFGAYDDMCDQLHQQVRQAERQAARAARQHPKAASPTPVTPP